MSSLRSHRAAGWLLGCVLWFAAIWFVADPWEGRRPQAIAMATLAPSSSAELFDAFTLREAPLEEWERFGCTLVDETGEVLEEPFVIRAGWQVLTRRVRCEEGGAPFWAAWHRVGVATTASESRQVASATLPGRLVVELLEDVAPQHANRALRGMLRTYGEELRLHSRRWRVPSFLLDQVRLKEESIVVLSSLRARLGENRLELEARVDVSLVFEFEARRIVGPKRRAPRRFQVRLTEQLSPLRLALRVTDTNAVLVESVTLERRGCQVSDVPFLSQLFSLDSLCDDVFSALQSRVERAVQDAIGARVETVVQQFEIAPLLAQLVSPWVRGALADEAFQTWWAELALNLQSLQLSADQVHIALEAAAPWTQAMPPWPVTETVGLREGRVLVSSVALLSLAQALFERPADELLAMAEAWDEPAVADQLARLQRAVEASGLMREEASKTGESLDAALALLGLEIAEDAVLRPRFWLKERHALGVGIEDLRALSVRGGEAGLSFTGWATLSWGTSVDDGLLLELWSPRSSSAGDLSLQLALSAYGHGMLRGRDAARLRAQLRLMRDGLARVEGRPPLQFVLPTVGPLSVAGKALELVEVWGDPATQVFGLSLRF